MNVYLPLNEGGVIDQNLVRVNDTQLKNTKDLEIAIYKDMIETQIVNHMDKRLKPSTRSLSNLITGKRYRRKFNA